jgi:hypothetical protein
MNTKEKLELLWKYLALIVVAALGFTYMETAHFSGGPKDGEFIFIGDEDHDFYGNELKKMDVNVEKEIVNGDTLMKVTVNGEEIDSDIHSTNNGRLEWKSKDGQLMIIDIDDFDGKPHTKEEHKKVIKKKIVIRDEG